MNYIANQIEIIQIIITFLGSILGGGFITYWLDSKKQKNDHYLNSPITYDVYSNLIRFSEEYIQELYTIIDTLKANGATDKILENTRKLHNIRRKYIMYLNKKITSDLENCEYALRELGAEAGYLESLPVGPERSKLVKNISERYRELLNIDQKLVTKSNSIDTFIEEIKLKIGVTDRINWLLEKTTTPLS